MFINTFEQAEKLKQSLFDAYANYGNIKLDNSSVWSLCLRILNHDKRFFCTTRWDNEKLVGHLILQKQQTWLNDDVIAQELSLFVQPEYRGQHLAQSMIDEAMQWAKQERVNRMSTLADDKTKALAEKLGFQLSGFYYYKDM